MKFRDEKGNVTHEQGFWETTGEAAEVTAAVGIGVVGVLGAGYLAVYGLAKGTEWVANSVAGLFSDEEDEEEEEAATETEEAPKIAQNDLGAAVAALVGTAESLKESFATLNATVEEMKKEKAKPASKAA